MPTSLSKSPVLIPNPQPQVDFLAVSALSEEQLATAREAAAKAAKESRSCSVLVGARLRTAPGARLPLAAILRAGRRASHGLACGRPKAHQAWSAARPGGIDHPIQSKPFDQTIRCPAD